METNHAHNLANCFLGLATPRDCKIKPCSLSKTPDTAL